MTLLTTLATLIDMKVPMSGGMATQYVNMNKEAILNQQIQYI